MDTFAEGFNALVIGATGGIGSAIVHCLENDDRCVQVIGLSRKSVPALDLDSEQSIKDAADYIASDIRDLALIIDATGILNIDGHGPEKTIRSIDPALMAKSFQTNAIGPALLFKHFSDLLPRDQKGVFATLSARVGSIGDNRAGGWISYRASKAALNQIMRVSAIEIVRRKPKAICVALHPGTVETRLSAPHIGKRATLTPHQSASRLLSTIYGLSASANGGFFAYDGQPIEW